MKKGSLLLLCLCLITLATNAQSFRYGVIGGINLNKPAGDTGADGSKVGLLLGAKGELDLPMIAKGTYLDFGLQISAKGYKSSIFMDADNNHVKWERNINYLNIPIHIGYKITCGKALSLFANAGPYMGIGLWGKIKSYNNGKETASSSKVFDENNGLKRLDYGIGVNIGLEYAKHIQLILGHDWGLKDINNYTGAGKYKNKNFSLSIAYLF